MRQHSQSQAKAATLEQGTTSSPQTQQYTTLPESMFEVYQPPVQTPQPQQYTTLPESMFEVYQPPPPSPNLQQNEEKTALEAQANEFRQQHNQLLERYEKLAAEMKRKKIDSFEALAEYDKESMKIFIELARLTPPMLLEGNNIGLFGSTSTGKSTMLNAILGQNLAETGIGETTQEIKAYPGESFTLWDVPGRNDEVSYFSMEYISFFKGLTRRLILIQATVKENSSLMKLLDELGLKYDIVFNKFDKVDEEEQPQVKEQIRNEIQRTGLRQVGNVFFVSAKQPKKFPDWMAMVEHLTNSLT